MPPPNTILRPGDIGQDLDDIRRQLHALNTSGGSPQPLTFSESVDATHPMALDFVIANGAKVTNAKLSFKFRLYRTTSSSAGGATGGQSQTHTHASAAHGHSLHTIAGTTGNTLQVGNAGADIFNNSGATLDINQVNSTTPGATGAASVDHTHAVGASSLGVSEGTSTSITAIGVDGVDKTALLGGGPWASDTVDLDVSAVLPLGDGLWHYISLTSAGQGRIVAVLRL